MGKFFKKYFWTMLIVVAALGLAFSAAYFSITGLSKLFAGSALQVIVLAAFLEFAKIVTTAALHRFWKSINWILKIPLTIMVLVIMGITSAGIYGFLSDAYSTTAIQLEKIAGQVELLEKQQEQKHGQILGIEEMKDSKSNRMTSLIDLRAHQEIRLDSLLANHHWTNAKRTQEQIDAASLEIIGLQTDIDLLISKINGVNEEIGVLDISILDLQHTDVATEIGPLKYMSTVLEQPMENIINWFILAIMVAFDPLAILLVILANIVYDRARDGEKENGNKAPPKKTLLGRLRERFAKEKPAQGEIAEPEPEPEEEWLEPDDEGEEMLVIEDEEPETESIFSGVNEAIRQGKKEDFEKAVEAAENTDDSTFQYSFPFAEDERNEVVEYVAGEDGEFKVAEEPGQPLESLSSIIQGIDSNPVYLQLLDALFDNGKRNVGDVLPHFNNEFEPAIRRKGIDCERKVIINFLTICALFKIINMKDKDNVIIIKDYEPSKQIVSLVSK